MMVTRQRHLVLTTAVLLAAAPSWAQAPASAVPADAEIRRILAERVDTHRQSVGIVVGVIEPAGRRIVTYGSRVAGDARPLDGDTIFEIGSMTKVFTALLLADAAERDEVALTDPVAAYLPDGVTMPARGGRSITLRDLANHTSGLPRLPANLDPADPLNPYADYSVEQMYRFLSDHQLTRDIGAQYEYSNLGAGLLGHVLARRAGMDYDALVRARITGPLGMRSTGIALSTEMRARLAAGHTQMLQPAANWDLPTLAGAGALRSSANDMLTFLSAVLGYTDSPLAPAMVALLADRRPTETGGLDIALGWHILTGGGRELVWHNGGTGGYRSFVGYDPVARVGVVILSNTSTPAGPDDIGRHLLDSQRALLPADSPLLQAPAVRTEIAVDPAVYDGHAGRYQLAPAAILTVTREGDALFVQLTGQPAFEVFPESETKYFLKVVDAQITFERDAQGRTEALVLHQNGVDQRAVRIEGDPLVPQEITLSPAVLDGYVGRYQLAPGTFVTIRRDETRLLAQLTGQPVLEIFASAEREFFYKVVDARITFEVDGQARATALVLHQFGRTVRAERID